MRPNLRLDICERSEKAKAHDSSDNLFKTRRIGPPSRERLQLLKSCFKFLFILVEAVILGQVLEETLRTSVTGPFAARVCEDRDVRIHGHLVEAGTPDGVSARVRVETVWHPPVLTVFVPDGWTIEATATSRTALR